VDALMLAPFGRWLLGAVADIAAAITAMIVLAAQLLASALRLMSRRSLTWR
jgi:hypothetical protein